jgi:hypothetical protein
VNLSPSLTLRASVGRERYLWTVASADSLLMMNTVEVALGRADAPGWAGEAVFQRRSFADENDVRTAYGWVLAPLVKGILRAGYAFSWSDATENRWVRNPATVAGNQNDQGQPRPVGSELPGVYAPYHTPAEEQIHKALAELTVAAGSATFRLDGSVGFRAREDAPVLIVTGLEPDPPPGVPAELGTRYFYERTFTPWNVRLRGTAPLSKALTLNVGGEIAETAYYEVKRFSMGLLYRFGVHD